MKHSASGSMTDPCKQEVEMPSEGNCKAVLQELYIDLCNLIVESRIPGINERGYGDGNHCPPLLGPNTHQCDFSLPECQKHQRLIHYLLQAVGCNIFEIEVLMLPDCCADSKLTERIQNEEYLLLERWSMKCISGKVQSTIEVPQLLRAVRSFLHFSQLSAWLSSTRGKSPANIYYWIKPSIDDSTTKFDQQPEVHFFPVCKISDGLFGCVTVKYPSRTQYIPVIPCSKHPPLRTYSLRTIDENPRICSNIPFSSEIVKQLQRTHDSSQSTLSAKSYLPESTTLVLTPTSLLKSFPTKPSDGKLANRVLKHSNIQTNLTDSSDLSNDSNKNQNINIISDTQTAYVVCNYTETFPKVCSQENCFNQRELAVRLRKARLKRKRLKKNMFDIPGFKMVTEPLQYSDKHNPTTGIISPNDNCCITSLVSDSQTNTSPKVTSPTDNTEINLEEDISCNYHQENLRKDFKKRKSNSFKRKQTSTHFETLTALPHKKNRCDTNISSQQFNCPSHKIDQTTLAFSLKNKASHLKIDSFINSELNSGQHCIETEAYKYGSHKNASEMDYNLQQAGYNLSNQSASSTVCKKVKASQENHNSWSKKRKFHDSFIQKSREKQCIDLNTPEVNISKDLSNFTLLNNELALRKKCKITNKCKYYSNLSFDSCDINFKPKGINKLSKTDLPCIAASDYVSLQTNVNKFTDLVKNENCIPQKEFISENIRTIQCKKDKNLPKYKGLKVKRTPKSVCKLKDFTYKMGISVQRKYRLYEKRKCISRNIFSNPFEKSKSLFFCKDVYAKPNVHRELQLNEVLQNVLHHSSEVTMQKNREFNSCTANSTTSNANALKKTYNMQTLKNIGGTRLCKKVKCSGISSNIKTVKRIKECEMELSKASNLILSKQIEANSLLNDGIGSGNVLESINTSTTDKSRHKQRLKKLCNLKTTHFEELCDDEKNHTLEVISELGNNILTPEMTYTKRSKNCINSNYLEDKSQGISQNIAVDYMPKPSMISPSKANPSAAVINRPLGAYRTLLFHSPNKSLECFPRHATKFPKGQKLLGNFEESILKGCLPTVSGVKGFHVEIGASGSFCPSHLTLPADVHFYDLGDLNQGAAPYVAHINLGNAEYYLPKKGAVQVTLFNPSETVVKMFVLNYDLSNMPPLCHTFIRQKIYYLPTSSADEYPSSPKWLRFIIHLRFASTKSGKIFLHKDFKIVILNKSNDDAASEFNQEPRELRSFLSVPMNPTFSPM